MDNESEMMLDALSRALSFEKLILLITDERSCGYLNSLKINIYHENNLEPSTS